MNDPHQAARGAAGNPRAGGDAMRRLAATPFGIELWLVDLNVEPDAGVVAALSRGELSRAQRFVFDVDRKRYLVAHCALAELLAARLSLPVGQFEWQFGANDKPLLPSAYDCMFNLSHCDDLALIGIATGLTHGVEIGVDIERLREVSDARALAAANFTVREQQELAAYDPAVASTAFLRGWTRKEACLKAIGSGLSIAPDTFDCGLGQRRGSTEIDGVTVEFECLDVGAEHVAAVAITRPGCGRTHDIVH